MDSYRKNIKSWSAEDRPREKLLKKGIQTLSDSELLALIIGSGTRELSAVDLSRAILQNVHHSLDELSKQSVHELMKLKGVGEAKAIAIVATMELGRRRKFSEPEKKEAITSSQSAFQIFYPYVADIPHEEFWVAYLNRSNRVIEVNKLSQGGVAGTVIDVRIIMKRANELLASALILCHNHPSGNLSASNEDKKITSKISEASRFFDIKLLDHLIIANDTYFSFADEGLLS